MPFSTNSTCSINKVEENAYTKNKTKVSYFKCIIEKCLPKVVMPKNLSHFFFATINLK